jgi:hypothetical protein
VQVGGVACGFGSGLAVLGVSFDEDGEHAEAAAELDVGPRVADDGAGLGCDVRIVGECLVEEAGQRLTAVALSLVVRAEIEGIDVGLLCGQVVLEGGVNIEHVGGGVETERDAALVRDDEYAHASAVELCDGFGDAGQRMELCG